MTWDNDQPGTSTSKKCYLFDKLENVVTGGFSFGFMIMILYFLLVLPSKLANSEILI
jgi:hypothetical protein